MTKESFNKPKIWLTIPQCESIYKRFRELQSTLLPESEPIPPIETRYPGRLESIVGAVENRAELLDYDVLTTAVCLYVLLAQSQAFFNANKRMSIVISGSFLYMNGMSLMADPPYFSDLTLMVSKDDQSTIEELIESVTPVFRDLTRQLTPKELDELNAFLKTVS